MTAGCTVVLQNCTDVLEAEHSVCTETYLTASDIKVEDDDVPEEEDPLAETLPATKVGQEVSYGQKTVYYQALLG
jgi:hypothetical protein